MTEAIPKPRTRTGKNLNVWLPEALVDALQRYVDESRPRTDKTAATEVALEEFLSTKGYWPPPPTDEE